VKPGEKAQTVIKKFGGRVVQVNPPDRIQKPKPSEPEEEAVNPGDPSE
jgi:hypothetical protein